MERRDMTGFDYALAKDSLSGVAEECGDEGIILENEGSLFVALLDALGHGGKAYDVACRARGYIVEHKNEDLPFILKGLNEYMQGSRGLVASLCRIDCKQRIIRFSGIGNIATKIHGQNSHSFIPREGIVGYLMPSPQEQMVPFGQNDILVLNSDGIKEHFSLMDHPDLFTGASHEIAHRMLARLRNRDDASCLVVRFRRCT
jgi:phosphoserine phosphatase RsbX